VGGLDTAGLVSSGVISPSLKKLCDFELLVVILLAAVVPESILDLTVVSGETKSGEIDAVLVLIVNGVDETDNNLLGEIGIGCDFCGVDSRDFVIVFSGLSLFLVAKSIEETDDDNTDLLLLIVSFAVSLINFSLAKFSTLFVVLINNEEEGDDGVSIVGILTLVVDVVFDAAAIMALSSVDDKLDKSHEVTYSVPSMSVTIFSTKKASPASPNIKCRSSTFSPFISISTSFSFDLITPSLPNRT
jgi:hypothetical protein